MRKSNSPIAPVIGCIVIQICVGILYLWSVFKTPITEAFNWSSEAAQMVSSYMLFAFVAGNLIGGFINDKKGPKLTAVLGVVMFSLGISLTSLLSAKTIGLINLTYSVLGGLGSGFAYGACVSCVQKWLPHRRGLASGLAVSAFAFSTVIFAPVSKWLMEVFKDTATGIVDFKYVFLILGGAFFVFGIIGCLFVKLPDEKYLRGLPVVTSGRVHTGKDYTLLQAMKTLPFWCIFFSILFINGTWTLTVPLIKDLGIERGLTEATAIFAVSFTGVANALGRLVMAALSDKIGRTATIIVLSVITFVGAVLMIFIGGYAYIAVVALIAFGYGGPASVNAAITTDFFGSKNSGTNYGVAMLALGFSSIIFNAISSTVLKGNVVPTYIMAAATALVPIFMMIVIRKQLKKKSG
ncbi:MAG: OFA family MFS transporter [Clostridiales bacterium]|nr:OFA family MFS transporter [Clostridiales bacterium]